MSLKIFPSVLADLPGEPSFSHFTKRDVNPVSGRTKYRNLAKPNEAMVLLHRRFFSYLRSWDLTSARTRFLKFSTASKRGDRTLKNVEPHRANRFFYLLDFHSAFGNVDPKRLAAVLASADPRLIGHEDEVEAFLRRHFFSPKHGLIQGGNAAPDLFNFYAGALVDVPLEPILREHRLTYTRYTDDLTFSSPSHIMLATRRRILAVVAAAGFPLSWKKCEYTDLRKRPVMITGIRLVLGGRLQVPRPFVCKVRAMLHAAAKPGSKLTLARIEGLMSPIRSSAPPGQQSNRIEQKLLAAYEAARAMCIREGRIS